MDSIASLKAVLGTAWRPEYRVLLEYIPRDQLTDIDRTPLGAGARGSVYAATWKRPSGLLGQETLDSEVKGVALKRIHDSSDFDSLSSSTETLFKEGTSALTSRYPTAGYDSGGSFRP